MMENAWLIPLFPLISFIVLLLFGRVWRERSPYVGIILVFLSFVLSLLVLVDRLKEATYKAEGTWLHVGSTSITMGFEVNQLNALMLVIVSLVSLLVHLYSKGYMKKDARIGTFFSYLGLFTFAMLGLVLAPNLLQLYIFWELVGVGSFLLIGFYFYKEEAKAAAKKAFIMTRIGDVGLFIGMMLLFWQVGSFEYDKIFQAVQNGTLSSSYITLTSILIFIGAIGKSGQLPLHSWLPDAMEGPTPVSALIHAATMVAAGVYLVASLFPLFSASETAMMVVATVGGVTALFAATIGLVQTDIKRVLAYSTMSQLGYMMLALGVGGYVAGVFHLTTHAFFKALLFLAAGSVIHAVHTQNIEEMGGLWGKLRKTGVLFLIGTMAISGVPLLSGFFSKEEIIGAAWSSGHYVLFALALFTAFLTSFYMFRLFFMVFTGEANKRHKDVHDSPMIMIVPMGVLAVLAVVAGYVNVPRDFLAEWLTKGAPGLVSEGHAPLWLMITATIISLAGIYLAYLMYGKKSISRDTFSSSAPFIYKLLKEKYYMDELYQKTIIALVHLIRRIGKAIDQYIVNGVIVLIINVIQGIRSAGSTVQNGQIQRYSFVAIIGLVLLLVIVAVTGGYL
ncbi:NADH-quinone oxidoreductase subunit L [Priestia koreensis]|uniref:NADH-quinone oxidoreductase subunit L n=1 Tax=Priestia koreensis TaxID=284581 RepID=UPI003458E5A6